MKYKIPLIIFIIFSILTLFPTIFDGGMGCVDNQCGRIIGTNYKDAPWFLALSNVSFNTYPFVMPNYAGALLRGYHILPNFIVHILSLIGISPWFSTYKLLPVIFLILLLILILKISKCEKNKHFYSALLIFFIMSSTTLSHLLSFFKSGIISNTNVLTPLYQSTRFFESLHFAFSILILLLCIHLLSKEESRQNNILLCILLFLSFGTKFYSGVIIGTLIIIKKFTDFFIEKRKIKFVFANIVLFGISSLLSIFVFFNPLDAGQNGSTFIISPFTTIHHLIEDPAYFYNLNMVNARYFLTENGWGPKLIFIEIWTTLLFVIYYFGPRIIGFIYLPRIFIDRKERSLNIAIFTTVFVSILLSILFVQKGDWFNTIQFGAYGAFIMAIMSAKTIYHMWFSRYRIVAIVLLIVTTAITMPANIVLLNYPNHPARLVIDDNEVKILEKLKNSPDGVVFAPAIDNNDITYVSAISHHQTYINFTQTLGNTGVDFEKRLENLQNLNSSSIKMLPVRYIYISSKVPNHKSLVDKINQSRGYLKQAENDSAILYSKIQ